MGKVHSIEQLEVAVPSHPGEWTVVGRTNYCELVKNNETGFLAEQYIIPANPRVPVMRSYEIYDFRRRQTDNLVEVYQVERQQPSYICQGGDYLRVKTERIPQRLSDVGIISHDEGIYVLQQALIGYRTIYNFEGAFVVNDDMIGFNSNGQVKVWLNNNFAKNTPDSELNPPRYEQNTYHASGINSERGMINQIVDVIQQHVNDVEFKEFLNTFYSVSPSVFTQALNFVNQYSVSRGIKSINGFRNNQIVNSGIQTVSHIVPNQGVYQQIAVPQQETILTQTHVIPSMNKSLQAPRQPVTIQNFAPSTIINYEQQAPTISYIQQQVSQVPLPQQTRLSYQQPVVYSSNIVTPNSTVVIPNQQIVYNSISSPLNRVTFDPQYQQQQIRIQQQQPQPQAIQLVSQPLVQSVIQPVTVSQPIINSFVRPSQIVHPTSQIVHSTSQIVHPSSQILQNVRVNNTVGVNSQIVTPLSQIRPSIIQNGRQNAHINNRLSLPPNRIIENQIKTASLPKIQQEIRISPTRINNSISPLVVKPTTAGVRRDISPQRNVTLNRGNPLINVNQSLKPTIVSPNSIINQNTIVTNPAVQGRSSHNIGRVLQGAQKTTVNSNAIIDQLSPTLVTANPIKTQNRNIRNTVNNVNNQIHGRSTIVQNQQQVTSTFKGLPHRRSNIHQSITPAIHAQINSTPIIQQATIQAVNNKISEKRVEQKTVQIDHARASTVTQQTLLDKLEDNINQALFDFSSPTIKPIGQPQLFASFGPGQVPQTILPTQAPSIPIARPVQPQRQTNSLLNSINYQPFRPQQVGLRIEQKSIFEIGDNTANIAVTSITQTQQIPQSQAINDSVNPEIRKLMMLPKNTGTIQTTIVETNIIENIPIAESHQAEDIVQQNIVIETFTIENTQQIQNPVINVQVSQNDLWVSNDSVPTYQQNTTSQGSSTQYVNQTINPSTFKQGVDIQLMMRQHNEQSKNLFQKYQAYDKNIQRQLPPNIPTSPSSNPNQAYGDLIQNNDIEQIIVVDYQPQIIPQPQNYQFSQTIQYQQVQQNGNIVQQVIIQSHTIETDPYNNNQYTVQQNIVIQTRYNDNQYSQPVSYQYQQYSNSPNGYEQSYDRQSRGYEYVTNEQNDQNPYAVQQDQQQYYRREQSGQTYNTSHNIHESRGTAPSYEELRAALLQSNTIEPHRQQPQYQQYTQYRYETTTYGN